MSMIRFEYESAILELLREYKDADPNETVGNFKKRSPFDCPLCKTEALLNNGRTSNCPTCPWVVMTGRDCMWNEYWFTPIKDRITQLEYWLEETGVEVRDF